MLEDLVTRKHLLIRNLPYGNRCEDPRSQQLSGSCAHGETGNNRGSSRANTGGQGPPARSDATSLQATVASYGCRADRLRLGATTGRQRFLRSQATGSSSTPSQGRLPLVRRMR